MEKREERYKRKNLNHGPNDHHYYYTFFYMRGKYDN